MNKEMYNYNNEATINNSKDIFTVQREHKKKIAENSISIQEIYEYLCNFFDYLPSEEYHTTLWKDQDGYYHLIFGRSEQELSREDKEAYGRLHSCLFEFYNHTFGTGVVCVETSRLQCSKQLCNAQVEGLPEGIYADWITVVSFLRAKLHSSHLYMMRELCRWLYTAK